MNKVKTLVSLITALMLVTLSVNANATSDPLAGLRSDDSRRILLRDYAKKQFSSSSNHCKTFADVAHYAANNVKKVKGDVGTFLEDMRLVIIGSDTFLRRKGKRGKYYMGVKTNDSGFKKILKDGSPQVEHAYAGIYFSKGALMVPGAVGFWGSVVEFIQDAKTKTVPTAADKVLYGYASDIGSRLANNNFDQIKTPITRTMCE